MDLTNERFEYESPVLDPATFPEDPMAQFQAWFAEAKECDPEPAAMVLATVDARHRPRGRVVLLRAVDGEGFTFYTNYGSEKGRALDTTGVASMTFYWPCLHRQVIVEGSVDRQDEAVSDRYFANRPRGSQISAWASEQSAPLASKQDLESRFTDFEVTFAGADVSRPPFWGGYLLRPDLVEFWQGQPNRLHDRVQYRRDDTTWTRGLLNP